MAVQRHSCTLLFTLALILGVLISNGTSAASPNDDECRETIAVLSRNVTACLEKAKPIRINCKGRALLVVCVNVKQKASRFVNVLMERCYSCFTDVPLRKILGDVGIQNVSLLRILDTRLENVTFLSDLIVLRRFEVGVYPNETNEIASDPVPSSLFLEEFKWYRTGISYLPQDFLSNKAYLQKLVIENNARLEHLPATFQTPSLKYLTLANNNISRLNGSEFARLANLTSLNIIGNPIVWLAKHTFASNRALLELQLSFHGTQLPAGVFGSLAALQKLSIVNGKLRKLSKDLFRNLTNLEHLDLSGNSLATLSNFVSYSHRLSTARFDNNEIRYLDDDIRVLQRHTTHRIWNNPIDCDCDELPRLYQIPNVEEFLDVELACYDRSGATQRVRMWRVLFNESFFCTKLMRIPQGCRSCLWNQLTQEMVLDCSGAELNEVPKIGGVCNELDPWKITLNLRNNSIKQLPPVTDWYCFDRVNALFVGHNNIREFRLDSFHGNISEISIAYNFLQTIDDQVMDSMLSSNSLQSLNLRSNPLSRNCYVIKRMLQLHKKLVNFQVSFVDSNHYLVDLDDDCQQTTLIHITLGFITLILAATTIGSLFYFKQSIKIWLFSHRLCLRWVTETELDAHLQYDAFLSYAHQDEDFIVTELLNPLELSHGFRLCIAQRDFIPGELIEGQIFAAIANSRRTIVYLSQGFLASHWARHEFRTAFEHSLHQNRPRLIVILAQEQDLEQFDAILDSQLVGFVRARTYLKRDDEHFWRKLLYAMPHSVTGATVGRLRRNTDCSCGGGQEMRELSNEK